MDDNPSDIIEISSRISSDSDSDSDIEMPYHNMPSQSPNHAHPASEELTRTISEGSANARKVSETRNNVASMLTLDEDTDHMPFENARPMSQTPANL
jgi:hypothetical protein